MSICRKRNPSVYKYTLNGHTLEKVHEYLYLGDLLSDDLKWSKQVDKITNKANSIFSVIRRNLKSCPTVFKQQAYVSVVRPVLEYGCVVWDPYLKNDSDKLENMQRRAARFVCNDYQQTSSVTNMLQQLNWETLSDRRKHHRLAFMHKITHELTTVPQDLIMFNERPQRHKN